MPPLASHIPIGLEALPPVAHILAGMGIAVGLVFWLLGRKLLGTAFALLGALLGGFIGFFIFPAASPETVFGAPSPYVGAVAGLALGVVGGIVLFRFAIAIISAGTLGAVGALVAATVLQFGPVQETQQQFTEAPTRATEPATTQPAAAPTPPPATPAEAKLAETEAVTERVKMFISSKRSEVETAWTEWTPHHRAVLGACAAGGIFMGFILGLFAPKRGAAGATALFGAALWLLSGVWIANAMSMPGREYINSGGAIGWLVAWLAIAGIGFAFQNGLGRAKKAEA